MMRKKKNKKIYLFIIKIIGALFRFLDISHDFTSTLLGFIFYIDWVFFDLLNLLKFFKK
jgi:hypothetical protein